MTVAAATDGAKLIEARDLAVHFDLGRRRGRVAAVDGVSLSVARGQTLGLVGESGSGKTTLAQACLGLVRPSAGHIRFDGRDLAAFGRPDWRGFRRRAQMVFQDPFSSLDPRMTIGAIVAEPLTIHGVGGRRDRAERVGQLLRDVGLSGDFARRPPQALSGGQRQRVGIARALALNPDLLICDEPVSALDVSVQAQILNLLRRLQAEYGLANLFISHDMAVVRFIAHTIAVMYLGKLVETGPKRTILETPRHPYTHALLSAVPVADPKRRRKRIVLKGDLPSATAPPSGCRFRTRCPLETARCAAEVPVPRRIGSDHTVACHYAETVPERMAEAATERPE